VFGVFLPCSIGFVSFDFDLGASVNNALAIFDATECAVCSSFLSAMTEAPQTENVIAPVYAPDNRWPQHLAEHDASASYSAACYQQVEHIGVFPVIVAKRKLSEIQRQIFLRDVMEAANDSTLEECPKRIDGSAYALCPARTHQHCELLCRADNCRSMCDSQMLHQ
jgi:hypothetical protein